RYGEGVRVRDEIIAVHVVTRGDSRRRITAGLEAVPGVLGDPAVIDIADGIQHGAAVLVEVDVISHCVAYDLQPDPLCLHRGRVRPVVVAFDGAVVHEIQFDVVDAPLPDQCAVRRAQILLCTGIGRVDDVERILPVDHAARVNGPAGPFTRAAWSTGRMRSTSSTRPIPVHSNICARRTAHWSGSGASTTSNWISWTTAPSKATTTGRTRPRWRHSGSGCRSYATQWEMTSTSTRTAAPC